MNSNARALQTANLKRSTYLRSRKAALFVFPMPHPNNTVAMLLVETTAVASALMVFGYTMHARDRSSFFVQAGHETTYASSGY